MPPIFFAVSEHLSGTRVGYMRRTQLSPKAIDDRPKPWPQKEARALFLLTNPTLPHCKIEIAVGVRLAAQGKMPPLLAVGNKAAAPHGLRQQGAVGLRLRTHMPV